MHDEIGCLFQSLEFVVDMRILVEMKIEHRRGGGGGGGDIFRGNNSTSILFCMKWNDGSVNANWRYQTDIHHEC